MKKNSDNYQYDSCISRGICSVNPRTSSLIIVLVLYIKIAVKYLSDLFKIDNVTDEQKSLILDSTELCVQGQEFSEEIFLSAIKRFKTILPDIISKYNNTFNKDCFEYEDIRECELFKQTENITDAIKLGEKVIRNKVSRIPREIRDLQQIMLVIAKSLSINLSDYESLMKTDKHSFETILKLFESINTESNNVNKLKEIIEKSVTADIDLMVNLRKFQEEQYGKQINTDVSYSTTPAKAVLVAGSNLKELHLILEALKDHDIDVYTHDEMMTAHTFPFFSNYKHLKGQYGQGVENCLIDFATFPGPIILTKHSLHNIDNFYRGRLFTTDKNVPKGVVYIKNNDFSEVIKSAEDSKGFKNGKICEVVSIGFDFDFIKNEIKTKIANQNISKIVLIGMEQYSLSQKSYFERLIKSLPHSILIISFSYNTERENLVHLNTCFDTLSFLKVYMELLNYNLPITIFMPKCNKNTISKMIYFTKNNSKVFVGSCTPIVLNPSLMDTLEKNFGIKSISNVMDDTKDLR